jgi:hypothetical protein
VWEHRQAETRRTNGALIGAQQNLNAALNGSAIEMGAKRLGPVEIAALMRDQP